MNKNLELKTQNLLQEIEGHNQARAALQKLTQELEMRVQERTAALSQALQDLHKSQAQLQHDALHDALTGLPNRTWLIQRLNKLIQENLSYAVLFIDLDRFKIANDSLGHSVGDELLKFIGSRMQACLVSPNKVARVGGDEFVVLLEEGEATEVAQNLLENFREPFNCKGYEIVIEVSIGITFNTMGYQYPMDAIRDADIAMYRAKQEKNGTYQVFNPPMQASVYARMQLEQDLRRAIAHQEFCLHYQPIVSLSTGELKGFEALVRWHHPDRLVYPNEFIPLAEETRLINHLGWWILQEACQQLQLWQQQFPQLQLFVTVNFSPVQFDQANVVEKTAEIIRKTGISRNSLKIEITESCLFNNVSGKLLHSLKNLGIGFCIDDFGTGYSSLSRLHEFPIDTLKIDRSFVNRINNNDDATIIKIILLLAQEHKMQVVAEGIETQCQMEKLRKMECHLGQGFFWSKALNSQEATEFITKG